MICKASSCVLMSLTAEMCREHQEFEQLPMQSKSSRDWSVLLQLSWRSNQHMRWKPLKKAFKSNEKLLEKSGNLQNTNKCSSQMTQIRENDTSCDAFQTFSINWKFNVEFFISIFEICVFFAAYKYLWSQFSLQLSVQSQLILISQIRPKKQLTLLRYSLSGLCNISMIFQLSLNINKKTNFSIWVLFPNKNRNVTINFSCIFSCYLNLTIFKMKLWRIW